MSLDAARQTAREIQALVNADTPVNDDLVRTLGTRLSEQVLQHEIDDLRRRGLQFNHVAVSYHGSNLDAWSDPNND